MTYCVAAFKKKSAIATATAIAIRYATVVALEKRTVIAAAHVNAIRYVGVALKKMTTTATVPAIRCVSVVAMKKMNATATVPVVAICIRKVEGPLRNQKTDLSL